MNIRKMLKLTAVAALPITAMANTLTGPSSSQSPYIVRARPGVVTVSVMSVGDSVNYKPDGVTPYRMVGVPDGLGAFDNGDGTFTLLMNHELGYTAGGVRAHGGTGSFVSRWVIDKGTLKVLSIQDLNDAYVTTTDGAGTLNTFNRFCSADLPPVPAFYNPQTGKGSQHRIFMNGEESSPPSSGYGRAIANVVDANGPGTGVGYELPSFNSLGAWENILAHPNTGNLLGDKTIVMANSDGGRNGVYMYVGFKTDIGSEADKAGLTGGTIYALTVSGIGGGAEDRNTPVTGSFTFTAIIRDADGNVVDGDTGTQFLRPEDGAWDPNNPNDYYFVTTDRYDQVKDSKGANIGRSRLYRLRFADITQPELGGTIVCLLDGTEGGNMFDNITITPRGSIFIQEDVGNQAHNGKIWRYSIRRETLELVAKHDPARFGDLGLLPNPPFTQDEESSGIIPLYDILGDGWLLCVVQAHYDIGDPELEQGGQLVLIHFPPGQEK